MPYGSYSQYNPRRKSFGPGVGKASSKINMFNSASSSHAVDSLELFRVSQREAARKRSQSGTASTGAN